MGLNSFKFSLTSPKETFSHASAKKAITIGRSLKCDFNVPKEDLSREHCLVELDQNEIFITDLGSKNGVSIDRVRMTPHKRYKLTSDVEVLLSNKYVFSVTPVGIEIRSKMDLIEHKDASPVAETVTIQLEVERPIEATPIMVKPPPKRTVTREGTRQAFTPEAIKMIIGFMIISGILVYSLFMD